MKRIKSPALIILPYYSQKQHYCFTMLYDIYIAFIYIVKQKIIDYLFLEKLIFECPQVPVSSTFSSNRAY